MTDEMKANYETLLDALTNEMQALHKELQECKEKLSQEPCEDMVSRSAVIDTLTKTSGIRGDALKALYDLPSVTPQPKVGRWIDGKCNKCGREALSWEMKPWPYYSAYCPYCGADMRDWCKDCKYFENGICKRWANKEYKTKKDGTCFMFEPKMQEVEE